MEKLVSVIVPAYNVEKYLDRCMDSICSQSYKNIEVILVDDGSVDSTPQLCDSWKKKDERISVVHQPNKGQCGARNVALDMAKGEYLMFVDSDDYIRRDMIARMIEVVERDGLDFIRAAYINVSEIENKELTDSDDTGEEFVFNRKQIIENFLTAPYSKRKYFTAIMWSALYKAHLFKSVRFPEGFIYEEGFVLPDVYLASESAGYINESLYYYRDNAKGTMASNKMSDKALKSIDDWKEIHYKFKQDYPEFNKITCERWIKSYLATLDELLKNENIDKDDFYKKKIYDTLVAERDYFVRMSVDKSIIKEIDALSYSVENWKNCREKNKQKQNSFLVKIISKIAFYNKD